MHYNIQLSQTEKKHDTQITLKSHGIVNNYLTPIG